MASISCEGVTKVFPDGTRAVDDVSLDIADGELMVLVGPSGCGKTTLLRMVAGLETISDGTVRIDDEVVNDVPVRDRDIAMVFQSYALYPQMTTAQNIGFGLKLRHTPKGEIQRLVERTASGLFLSRLLERRPRQLSGGQRQRVAMGRAIVRAPRVFLMDEPLSNLDAKLRFQMRGEISRLQRDLQCTTIYVTHDQTEAMTLGDRVAVMRHGVVQQVDRPQVLYRRPRNLFVAGFMGSPAMNLVEARVEIAGDRCAVVFGEHRLTIPESRLAASPALRQYAGRTIVLGIRPEHIEDAMVRPDWPADARLSATVELREEMGPETYLYLTVDAKPVLTDDIRELQADIDAGALEAIDAQAGAGGASFVARVDPRTAAREGERMQFAIDTAEVHLFDLESGDALVSTDAIAPAGAARA
jgi:multiple sugar transport system ATP-binding protein